MHKVWNKKIGFIELIVTHDCLPKRKNKQMSLRMECTLTAMVVLPRLTTLNTILFNSSFSESAHSSINICFSCIFPGRCNRTARYDYMLKPHDPHSTCTSKHMYLKAHALWDLNQGRTLTNPFE
ncbi:hypothetical protein TNCV_527131 [Trichonephila clavipes]|nr:hypothetical protein TNCV_527131 [Trichonephila clavipes]